MLDPAKKLTPLQRRRLKEGKPITSRPLSETEKKHEDNVDTEKLKNMQKKNSPEPKKRNEEDDIEYRKEMRHAEHLRREAVQQKMKVDTAAHEAQKQAEAQKDLERSMNDKDAEARKESEQRAKRAEAMAKKYGSDKQGESGGEAAQPQKPQEPQESDEQKAEKERQLQEEAALSVERDRLEAMVDEAVMTEERRLRAMLDVGTPDNLEDVCRRLRANDPRLIKVTLRQNDIGFPQAARLADAIAHNSSLLALDFRYNKIGDYGCKLIADALQTCPSIGELRVQPNYTGRTGMEALQEAARLCTFEAMSISSATLAMPEESFSPLLLRAPNEA